MRSSLLTSLALACGALVFSIGAKAIPVHVGITGAAGQQSWTSPGFGDPSSLTLSAWQFDATSQTWVPAYMTLDQDGSGNPGLGVCGTQPDANFACTDTNETNEIDSIPRQIIDMDITQFNNWTGFTITLLSFEQSSWDGLYGAACSPGDSNANCQPALLTQNCTAADANGIVSCALNESDLTGFSHIWISPVPGCSPRSELSSNCNFLLGAGEDQGFIFNEIPEPATLGMFGLGILLIGVFLGLRRRRMR